MQQFWLLNINTTFTKNCKVRYRARRLIESLYNNIDNKNRMITLFGCFYVLTVISDYNRRLIIRDPIKRRTLYYIFLAILLYLPKTLQLHFVRCEIIWRICFSSSSFYSRGSPPDPMLKLNGSSMPQSPEQVHTPIPSVSQNE